MQGLFRWPASQITTVVHPATHARQPCTPWTACIRPSIALLAASPANRCMPSCFGPGAARLPPHPVSPTPTTRH